MLILVYLCKWGPCAAMLIAVPVSVHSLCNYDWTALTVTTWTNVFRDQKRPDSSSWVMTFHPPVCPANERGFMSSAACRRPTGSLLSSTSGEKKKEKQTFFLSVVWEWTKWISLFHHRRENASSVFALMWLIQWKFDMINSSVMMSWRWPQKLHTSRARAL